MKDIVNVEKMKVNDRKFGVALRKVAALEG